MKAFASSLIGIALVALLAGCSSQPGGATGKVMNSTAAGNDLTVSLATPDGVLKHGDSQFTLTFADASGQPVDVGAVGLTFHMPQMGTMAEMNQSATFTTTSTPGVYNGRARIEMTGEWQVRITYEGPKGRGQASFPVTVQ